MSDERIKEALAVIADQLQSLAYELLDLRFSTEDEPLAETLSNLIEDLDKVEQRLRRAAESN